MENDWKVLEKGNIPSDILTGDYEFRDGWAHCPSATGLDAAITAVMSFLQSRRETIVSYKKRQPKAPTHKDIVHYAEWKCSHSICAEKVESEEFGYWSDNPSEITCQKCMKELRDEKRWIPEKKITMTQKQATIELIDIMEGKEIQ